MSLFRKNPENIPDVYFTFGKTDSVKEGRVEGEFPDGSFVVRLTKSHYPYKRGDVLRVAQWNVTKIEEVN